MRIKIEPNSIEFEELKTSLVNQFADYQLLERNKNVVVIKKNPVLACNVVLRRKRLVVVGTFADMKQQLIFTMAVIFLGVLIPMTIYLVLFHKKFKAYENEIGAFLKHKYQR